MAMDPVQDLAPGREVFSRDGHKLGTVKEVSARALKIDVPLRPDYWLPRERVLSYTNERVTMDLDRDEVDDHTLDDRDAG